MYSLSTVFAFKNLFHAYLAFFEFFCCNSIYMCIPGCPGLRSTDRCEHICKHFASFHRCASRTWQCNIRITQIVCKKRRTRNKRKPEKKNLNMQNNRETKSVSRSVIKARYFIFYLTDYPYHSYNISAALE